MGSRAPEMAVHDAIFIATDGQENMFGSQQDGRTRRWRMGQSDPSSRTELNRPLTTSVM